MQSVLDGHDPSPAAVIDARGVTRLANAAARRLFPGALEMRAEESIDAFFGRWGPAHVENWPEVAWAAADRRRARAGESGDPELRRLAERVREHLRDTPRPPSLAAEAMPPVIYARIRLGEERLSFFSAVLRFEGARDVTLSELGVELTFPADEPTAAFLRKAAEDPSSPT